jgi:hypothetical protein
MPLLSAQEDFVQRTLGALNGIWKKLVFTTGLKGDGGKYRHWGMEREHGVAASQEAIEAAHRALILELVEMEIPKVVYAAGGLVEMQKLGVKTICPTGLENCLRKHADYVLWTTQAILAAQAQAGCRAA